MRCGRWLMGVAVVGFCWMSMSGCVSLDQYRRLEAAHRMVTAEKEARDQELYDKQAVHDSLLNRIEALENELRLKDDLVANLQREKDLLDELRRTAQDSLERVADQQTLGDIVIAGNRLPEPLDNALKGFADRHRDAVTYDASRGTLKWKSDLLFASGSDVVRNESRDTIRQFADVIKSAAATDFEVLVAGHTDNQPIKHAKAKHPTNWHLSAHRAIAVGEVLLKYGYSPERLAVMGCGEYRPIAENSTKAGNSKNRRVEIYLVPRGSVIQVTEFDLGNGSSIRYATAQP